MASDVAAALGRETDHLFWVIDAQAGNFSFPALEELGDPDELIERFWLFSPALENCSTAALQPGAVSALGTALGYDEGFYLAGLQATPENIESNLSDFMADNDKNAWWNLFGRCGEILIEDIDDGMAYLFTTRRDWHDELSKIYPKAKSISVERWRQDTARFG